jgi:hypothetical protein
MSMINKLLLACSALLSLWCCGPLSAQSVQLADGRVLLASVEDADGEGLRIKRLDNGGALELRWDHLSAASALAWKRKFDLAGDSQDEALTRADAVDYFNNGSKQSVIGRITEQAGDHIVVVVKGVPFRVPRAELRAVRKVEVPVTQVFTRDEYYADRLAAHRPGEKSDVHVLLAEELIKVRDYEHADFHLTEAKRLGNSRNPQQLDTLIAKLQRYRDAAKELGQIEEIRACRSRGGLQDFDKGTKLIEKFAKDFPQTKLKAEFDGEKKRFAEARTRFLANQVADLWRRSIQILADKKVGEDGMTLDTAREYAQGKMSDDIQARVAGILKLDPAEVKALWSERAKYPVGRRAEHFTYGVGSWVLGETAILKDTEAGKQQGKQPAKAANEQEARDVERFAKLLRQAMERRRGQQQAGGEQEEETEADWWRKAERQERTSWLRAFYAESGGQMVITYATVSPCVACYAEGTTVETNAEGKMVRTTCFLCHKTKQIRSFKAY